MCGCDISLMRWYRLCVPTFVLRTVKCFSFLVCTLAELKRLLLQLTGELLESGKEVTAARLVGRNIAPNEVIVWVLSQKVVLSSTGVYLSKGITSFVA